MKINQTIVATFLIGAVIGGGVIGFVNAVKPIALFSSAAAPECESALDNHNEIAEDMNERPYEGGRAAWDSQLQNAGMYRDQVETCQTQICDPFYDMLSEYYRDREYWQNLYNQHNDELYQFWEDHHPPLSPQEQFELDELYEQFYETQKQFEHYNALYLEAENELATNACDMWENQLTDILPYPDEEEDPPNYDYRGKRAY